MAHIPFEIGILGVALSNSEVKKAHKFRIHSSNCFICKINCNRYSLAVTCNPLLKDLHISPFILQTRIAYKQIQDAEKVIL